MATDYKDFPVMVAEYSFKILEHYFHGKLTLLTIPHIFVIRPFHPAQRDLPPTGNAIFVFDMATS